MSFEVLRASIKTKLQGLSAIQVVYDYPTEDFTGYPAAMVRSVGNESKYSTTKDNERHYVFEIFVIQESESDLKNRRKARQIIESAADDVMNAFDRDEYLSGISLPTNYTIVGIIPALSGITDEEKYVVGKIELTIKIVYNVA